MSAVTDGFLVTFHLLKRSQSMFFLRRREKHPMTAAREFPTVVLTGPRQSGKSARRKKKLLARDLVRDT